jgi:ankyrin repeat protein
VRIIEELLKYGADPTDCDFCKKFTPLHYAAATNNMESIQCLIKAGADINAGLPKKSPLYCAVQNNAIKCVKVLLQAGASPNNPQVYTKFMQLIKAPQDNFIIFFLMLFILILDNMYSFNINLKIYYRQLQFQT